MLEDDEVKTFKPNALGVVEVLHAKWRNHCYPLHTHDTWTLLVVDEGVIGYRLGGRDHVARRTEVTLLPPHVAHDGHALSRNGFRKRVMYLEPATVDTTLTGAAVDVPTWADGQLRTCVSLLDRSLVRGDVLEGETLLALVTERLNWHLGGRPTQPQRPLPTLAVRRVREILDADPLTNTGLRQVASQVGISVPHLVRAFTREYGIPPHQYLLGRRLDVARRLLLDGHPVALVATRTGFYDQAHFNRHFRRFLRTTPQRYRTGSAPGAAA